MTPSTFYSLSEQVNFYTAKQPTCFSHRVQLGSFLSSYLTDYEWTLEDVRHNRPKAHWISLAGGEEFLAGSLIGVASIGERRFKAVGIFSMEFGKFNSNRSNELKVRGHQRMGVNILPPFLKVAEDGQSILVLYSFEIGTFNPSG